MDRIQKYFLSDDLNQSSIKAILAGLGTYLNKKKGSFDHFVRGNAVDFLITQENELFENYFYVYTDKVTKGVKKVIDYLYDSTDEEYLPLEELNIPFACKLLDYQKNWKDETLINDVISKGSDYYIALINCGGRQIISEEDYELAKKIVDSLSTHKHTAKYIDKDYNKYYYDQLIIYFKHEDINCKAMLDRVIVNHHDRTIQPLDIKTIGDSTKAFPSNVKRFRYDIQAKWYLLALEYWIENELVSLKGYEILPFRFIVESTKSPGILPLVYKINNFSLKKAYEGYYESKSQHIIGDDEDNKIVHRYVEGIKQGIEKYKYHYYNDQWEMEQSILESNGEIEL